MGSFFAGPPNPEPFVPSGQDAYDIPPPSFRLIGQAIGSGLKDAGAVASNAGGILDWLAQALALIVGWFLGKLLGIIAYLIGLINTMYEGADPGIDAIARRSLEHVFQIPAGGSEPRRLAAGTDTAGAARALGKSITDALTQGTGGSVGQPLQPSTAGAEAFLGKLARIGIEGWVEGAIPEFLTVGQVKAVMELTPIMSEILGFGHLARRVTAPLVKILVEDPATWRLNLDYRPALLPEAMAVREYLRGKLTPSDLDNALGRLGYSPTNIAAVVNLNTKQLQLAELDYLVSHGGYSEQQATDALAADGYDQATALNLLHLAEQRRIDTRNLSLLDAQIAAYERGEIDDAALSSAVDAAPIAPGEGAVLKTVVFQRRQLNVKHLTLAEVETLVKAHIMSLDDVTTWMTRENYPAEEQTLLELWLFGKITSADQAATAKAAAATAKQTAAKAKQAAAQQKAAAAAAKAATKGVSLADFQKLVESGQRTMVDYRTFLGELGLPASSVTDLVDLLTQQLAAKKTAADQHAALLAEADTKHVPLATTEKNVINGTISLDELKTWMQNLEYSASDIALAVDYVDEQLAAQKAKAATKANGTAAAATKGISLPELERAARLGLTSVADYSAALTKAGFDPTSVDLMTGILADQIATDKAAAATRKGAVTKAGQKGLSLAQLEAAVVAGTKTMADYTAALTQLGYSADDVSTLADLLQLKVDHAADVAKAKGAATKALGAKGLSLPQLENAVKLGVMTIDQYNQALTDAGFSAQDVTILSSSLLAEVAKVAKATKAEKTATGALATKGLNLAEEQQLVLNGVASLDDYAGYLAGQGYSATAAQQLIDLLSLKVDQAKAAAATHALATQKAADKDISLAKEETAVVDGVRTMADYNALLADLGFNAIDQATLDALLQSKIDAKAAKAGASPPAPAPIPPQPGA